MTPSVVMVGAGGFAQLYLKELAARSPQIRLVGIVDPLAAQSPLYHTVSHLPCYNTLEEFYRHHTAQLAIIASPIQHHHRQTITALQYKSDVLCEKPLCATWDQAREICRLSQQLSRTVTVGYQWSFSRAILAAKSDILAGRYGDAALFRTKVLWPRTKAYYTRNNWAGRIYMEDGTPVYDSVLGNATSHYLHNTLFLLGESMDQAAQAHQITAKLLRVNAIENYDTAFVRFAAGGAMGWLAVSHTTAEERRPFCEYLFAKGRLLIQNERLFGMLDGQVIDYGETDSADNISNKLDAALQAIRSGRSTLCSASTAACAVAVIDRLQGMSIEDIPPQWVVSQPDRLYVPVLDSAIDRCFEQTDWSSLPF